MSQKTAYELFVMALLGFSSVTNLEDPDVEILDDAFGCIILAISKIIERNAQDNVFDDTGQEIITSFAMAMKSCEKISESDEERFRVEFQL